MAEGQTRFSEFERRLEKEHPVAYHEEIELRADIPIGLLGGLFVSFHSCFLVSP